MIFQIETIHFVAGGEIFGGKVTRADHKIKHMMGWEDKKLYEHCRDENLKLYLFDEKNQKESHEIN